MSTLKSINVIHPSATVNNIVNDASGNVTVGNDLYVTSGNVGIGTSSPAYPLDVNGNVQIRSGNSLYFFSSSYGIRASTGLELKTLDVIRFLNGTTENMRIDSSGNVGIGATANASAILDAQSTTKGVRFPNMTTTQKNAVSSPAAGLVVFDTTLAKLCVYSGAAWQTITSV